MKKYIFCFLFLFLFSLLLKAQKHNFLNYGDTIYCSNYTFATIILPKYSEIDKIESGTKNRFFHIEKKSNNTFIIQAKIDVTTIENVDDLHFGLVVFFKNYFEPIVLSIKVDSKQGVRIYKYVDSLIAFDTDNVVPFVSNVAPSKKNHNIDTSKKVIDSIANGFLVGSKNYFLLKSNMGMMLESDGVVAILKYIYVYQDNYYVGLYLYNKSPLSYTFSKPQIFKKYVAGGVKGNFATKENSIAMENFYLYKKKNNIKHNQFALMTLVLSKTIVLNDENLFIYILEEIEKGGRNIVMSITNEFLKKATFLVDADFKQKRKKYFGKKINNSYKKFHFFNLPETKNVDILLVPYLSFGKVGTIFGSFSNTWSYGFWNEYKFRIASSKTSIVLPLKVQYSSNEVGRGLEVSLGLGLGYSIFNWRKSYKFNAQFFGLYDNNFFWHNRIYQDDNSNVYTPAWSIGVSFPQEFYSFNRKNVVVMPAFILGGDLSFYAILGVGINFQLR